MSGSADRTLLWVLMACFASQLVLALTVVPPWQHPDEPQHVMTARLVHRHGANFVLDVDRDDAGERAIVASMARYGWWTHYGEPTPDPVPVSFAEGPSHVVRAYFGPPSGGSRLYYRAVAAIFRLFRVEGVLGQMYAMRMISAACGLLSLLFMWVGTRRSLGLEAAAVVTSLLALHSQFVLVSTAANPDAVVNALAIGFWSQALALVTSGPTLQSLALLWTAGLAGFLIRRVGAPLLIVAAAMSVLPLISRWRPTDRRVLGVPWFVAAGVALLLLVAVGSGEIVRGVEWVRFDPVASATTIAANASELPRYATGMFMSFWLYAGWLRHPAPTWWYAAAAVIAGVAVLGLIARRNRSERPVIALAAGMVAIQIAAIIAYHFGILQSGAQGKYLFPVLPAVLLLVWIGWRRAADVVHARRWAAIALVTLIALLNLSGWLLVVLPVNS